MKHELKRFLDKLEVFNPEEVTELCELLKVIRVEKGALLLKEGQICNSCFFVLKGCMRKYVTVDGDEKNLAFYTEEQAINFFTSYSKKTPSDSYLSAVEDTILLEGNPDMDAEIFAKFPKLQHLTRKRILVRPKMPLPSTSLPLLKNDI